MTQANFPPNFADDQKLTHLDQQGAIQMVDTSGKTLTIREAVATGKVRMKIETLGLFKLGMGRKGMC